MAGFFKVSFISEHMTNLIVNVFRYRSTEWLPLQGNPFEDTLAALDAIILKLKAPYLACQSGDTRLLRVEGVGYDDSYGIVTPSPLVRTINEAGGLGDLETSGSFVSANIGLRCGAQTQINGVGHSQRNRGYLSIGPIGETTVDKYGHLTVGFTGGALNTLAAAVDDNVTVLVPAVTCIPIRIHEKWVVAGPVRVLQFRTYSDVLGYTLPRSASVRRSRMGEA